MVWWPYFLTILCLLSDVWHIHNNWHIHNHILFQCLEQFYSIKLGGIYVIPGKCGNRSILMESTIYLHASHGDALVPRFFGRIYWTASLVYMTVQSKHAPVFHWFRTTDKEWTCDCLTAIHIVFSFMTDSMALLRFDISFGMLTSNRFGVRSKIIGL